MIETYKKMYTKLEDLPSKYITAKQVVNLKSLGIDTIYDLIYYFPVICPPRPPKVLGLQA